MRRHSQRPATPQRSAVPPDFYSLIHSYDSDHNPSRPARSSPLGSSVDTGLPLELLDRLKAFPLFQSAPDSFLLSIGKSLRPSVYQPTQEIIREGEDAKAMYWLVRGAVRVTSRDGESTYAELRPGAFFGEIGILMNIPRTASIVASIRSLVVRLNKEDLQKELPSYPLVETAIRDEALERLAILEHKKKERVPDISNGEEPIPVPSAAQRKRQRDSVALDVEMVEAGSLADGEISSNKKRKSPSPDLAEIAASSTAVSPPLTVRQVLKELPLFEGLPPDVLHFLGINAQPVTYPPFTVIIRQGDTGRDIYFIITGAVEVFTEQTTPPKPSRRSARTNESLQQPEQQVRARLKAGQYFGEVASLSLAPRRTATVRSVASVACLLISGDVLDDLWRRCSPSLRQQVENEARRRMKAAVRDEDVVMSDDTGLRRKSVGTARDLYSGDDDWRKDLPIVTFDRSSLEDKPHSAPAQLTQMEPLDPDPFFNENLDNMRARSRRSSLAPPVPPPDGQTAPLTEHQRTPSSGSNRLLPSSPLKISTFKLSPNDFPSSVPGSPLRASPMATRRPSLARQPSNQGRGKIPDSILVMVFQHLDLLDLMQLRRVSMHWNNLLSTSADVLHKLDLSIYNKYVTDAILRDIIIPFIGNRSKEIDLSNCFHITDEGFKALTEACAEVATVWKMKSVWDVSGSAVLAFVDKAKGLEEIDLSNCRKVSDTLLARIIGWVVPQLKPGQHANSSSQQQHLNGRRQASKRMSSSSVTFSAQDAQPPPPGTVIGAPKLKRITLSYCKHIQDRAMAHIAIHAAERLESLDLTRCTSISDAGFHSWGIHDFRNLRKLVLADCTYLSDQAIVGVVGGCRGLRELDLSFCCALSDTATEIVSLGLPGLRRLDMAFCGSAISDNSLRCIGLHLLELRHLSVRGCVRVTGQGVETVVEGCQHLDTFDVSQCKNLHPWIDRGGVQRVNSHLMGRTIRFDTVANGMWRTKPR